jgi:hypothetical protein
MIDDVAIELSTRNEVNRMNGRAMTKDDDEEEVRSTIP